MKQLRQYIRQILSESMWGMSEAEIKDLYFVIDEVEIDYIRILAYELDPKTHKETIAPVDFLFAHTSIGEIHIKRHDGNVWEYKEGPCAGTWHIAFSSAEHGLGPLLYDLAMEVAGADGIMPDRNSVSEEARKVWRYYKTRRSDVKAIPLDYIDVPFVTKDDLSDDCTQHIFLDDIDKTYSIRLGREKIDKSAYFNHWSTHRYVKHPLHGETIKTLLDMGRLGFDGLLTDAFRKRMLNIGIKAL